ncbi:MAG: cysteine desulfurase [Clostridia bacterium]|nr:cysteine desulfurase [Clostridia bacterium]
MVYLDNSATTKPCVKAVEYINNALCENWGNPSSLHLMGMNAEIAVSEARGSVATFLHCREDEIFFTSCGTESNNTAIMSIKYKKHNGKRIITTAIEHPSVLEPIKALEKEGYEVIYLHPDKSGVISLEELKSNLNSDTCLVSIMLVNNEIGSIQPIIEAAELTKRIAPNALFHTDAVQAFGKLPINLQKTKIDLLSASGHKIHGPKGIGILYKRKGVNISPLLLGGGQEKNLRSGTECVPLICGLKGAIDEIGSAEKLYQKQKELFDYAHCKLCELDFIKFNSNSECIPYIINISVPGYRSEVLQHFLERKNIFVSSGSACAKGELSYVLREIEASAIEIDGALRLSFSRYNTNDDVDSFCSALCEAVSVLKKSI